MTAVALEQDDPFAADEPAYDHPAAVEELRKRYERVAADLSNAYPGYILDTVYQADGGELYYGINHVWAATWRMSIALNWLLLGEVPIYSDGAPKAEWVIEYFAGPWPEVRP